MSDIKAQIKAAMKDAMRAKAKERLSTIRLIQSEFKRIEVDERIELDDARVLVILDKMLKQRRDSITQYESANRPELAEKEANEIDVIQCFLPEQLSTEDITALVNDALTQTQATSMKDMGKIMALVKPQIQGRADIAQVSSLIKTLLN